MGITRRQFVSKSAIGIAGLPFVHGLSWAQAKGKLGYMKIVDNAAALIATGDVDGFLVGGASLDPTAFVAIVRAAAETPAP